MVSVGVAVSVAVFVVVGGSKVNVDVSVEGGVKVSAGAS